MTMMSTATTATEPITDVIFRVWRNDSGVIALMPYLPHDINGVYCTSYEHIGQHGAASYDSVMLLTRPATEAEYLPLKRELESAPYGYRFRVIRRRNRRK